MKTFLLVRDTFKPGDTNTVLKAGTTIDIDDTTPAGLKLWADLYYSGATADNTPENKKLLAQNLANMEAETKAKVRAEEYRIEKEYIQFLKDKEKYLPKAVAPAAQTSGAPAELPRRELTDDLIWATLDAIEKKLQNPKLRRPTHSDVFKHLCRDKLPLKSVASKYKCAPRTVTSRKTELDAFLHREFGLKTEDYFMADESMFRGYEKMKSDHAARRINPYQVAGESEIDEDN